MSYLMNRTGCALSATTADVAELMSSDQTCCRHVAATFLPRCRRWVRRKI